MGHRTSRVSRRAFVAASAAIAGSLAAPRIARSASAQVLRFVPQADLGVLDPIWTTTYPTRDHAYLVFDTLYGQEGPLKDYAVSPQMVEGHTVENDGRLWKMTLRRGLLFHDNEPVLAKDCVASIKRWSVRDSFGQAVMAATDELSAPDDRTIQFRLKRPFPMLPAALGKTPPSMCPIMPARLAATSPFQQVTEMVGSGPYKFNAKDRIPGAQVAYDRFADYKPRPDGTPDWTAGPKVAHFERIEWKIIPDSATVLGALRNGEVDWWWVPDADLIPVLKRSQDLVVRPVDPTGMIATMRFNWLHPPFDNPAIRRAVIGAIDQATYMTAVAGTDSSLWRAGVGYFCPDTPFANDAGMAALTGPRDVAKVRQAIQRAGYNGEKIALLAPVDIPTVKALAEVCADMMQKIGLNVDHQSMDWGTLVQRRTSQQPVDKGGWSVFSTFWNGLDHINPAVHPFLRGNGKNAGPGWPDDPKIEALRDTWLRAPDFPHQKKVATQLQLQAFQSVPYIPLGQEFIPTAYRKDLAGVLNGIPVFWNIHRDTA